MCVFVCVPAGMCGILCSDIVCFIFDIPNSLGSLVKTHDNWVMGVTLSFLNTCALLHLNMLESFQ